MLNESFVGVAIFHFSFFAIMVGCCIYYMNKGQL